MICGLCEKEFPRNRYYQNYKRSKDNLQTSYTVIWPPADMQIVGTSKIQFGRETRKLIMISSFIIITLIGIMMILGSGSENSTVNQNVPSNSDYEICVQVTFNRKIAEGWPVQMALNYSRQVC